MRITIAAALAATTLAFAPLAQANEGNGNPFPFTADPIATTWVAGRPSNQNPFPFAAAALSREAAMPRAGSTPSEAYPALAPAGADAYLDE